MDLTIDVGVLMAASGLGAPEFHNESLDLTERIKSDPVLLLAMDKKGKIEHQYRSMMRPSTYGHLWITLLASKNKVVIIDVKKLNRGIVTALKEAHFDPEDYKYVEMSASTTCKVLVSHDHRDYSEKVRRILRRVDVSVRTAGELNATLSGQQDAGSEVSS